MLQVKDLSCKRGSKLLWEGISFELNAGQCLRVNGANGAGKSTLLRVVSGLTRSESGQIYWNQADITAQLETFHSQMIYLGHLAPLKGDMNAIENLIFLAQLNGQEKTIRQARQALIYWGLDKLTQLPVRAMSQGQRQRVALSRLLLVDNCPLWILDEAWNSLDKAGVQQLNKLITDHLQNGGMAIVTSHQDVSLDNSSLTVQELSL
jgi:heme exporter protein A